MFSLSVGYLHTSTHDLSIDKIPFEDQSSEIIPSWMKSLLQLHCWDSHFILLKKIPYSSISATFFRTTRGTHIQGACQSAGIANWTQECTSQNCTLNSKCNTRLQVDLLLRLANLTSPVPTWHGANSHDYSMIFWQILKFTEGWVTGKTPLLFPCFSVLEGALLTEFSISIPSQ